MDRSSWQKTGPVLSAANANFGTGHNCFFLSPDGTEIWVSQWHEYAPRSLLQTSAQMADNHLFAERFPRNGQPKRVMRRRPVHYGSESRVSREQHPKFRHPSAPEPDAGTTQWRVGSYSWIAAKGNRGTSPSVNVLYRKTLAMARRNNKAQMRERCIARCSEIYGSYVLSLPIHRQVC